MYKEKLLELRSRIAKSTKGATYLIFNDKELEELLLKRPRSIEELSKIKGFPLKGKRVTTYGKDLVKIFNDNGVKSSSLDIKNSSFF